MTKTVYPWEAPARPKRSAVEIQQVMQEWRQHLAPKYPSLLSSKPPSTSSRKNTTRADNARPTCEVCDDKAFVTKDVSFDHADFGKAFPCPACRSGVNAVQMRLDRLFKTAGVGMVYRRFRLADFEALDMWVRSGKETAIAAAQMWAGGAAMTYAQLDLEYTDSFERPSLVLYGPAGTGKTALAGAAFCARLEREGAGLLINFYDLINAIQATYGSTDGGKSIALLEAVQTAPLLMIDDLGDPDRLQFAESDDRRQKLYSIVNYRCGLEMPTIITTNLMPDDIREQFGLSSRILDRLGEMAVLVEMAGIPLRPGVAMDRH